MLMQIKVTFAMLIETLSVFSRFRLKVVPQRKAETFLTRT